MSLFAGAGAGSQRRRGGTVASRCARGRARQSRTRYAGTRHNIGFEIANELARRWQLPRARKRFGGLISEGGCGRAAPGRGAASPDLHERVGVGGRPGPRRSRRTARPWSCSTTRSISLGEVRSKLGGGLAGHNGLKSLGAGLGGPDFWRVRAGVGRPESTDPEIVSSYVLSRFREPKDQVANLIEAAADEAERLVEEIAAGAGAKDEADASPHTPVDARAPEAEPRATRDKPEDVGRMMLTSYSVDESGSPCSASSARRLGTRSTPRCSRLLGHLASARDDEAVRVLVISSNDHLGLSAGADVREELNEEGVNRMQLFADLYAQLTDFPKPTVAACHGAVVGAGAESRSRAICGWQAATCG